jgi:DNA-directed RNA polymerase subunit RPC12/RpoP
MASGNIMISQGYCSTCGKQVKCEKNALAWGGGDFILALFSFGAWVILKWIFAPSWRCSQCGSKV